MLAVREIRHPPVSAGDPVGPGSGLARLCGTCILLEAFDLTNMVAIDFTDVTFLDSSGIGVIAAGFKRAATGRPARPLVGMAKPVRTVLKITGLDQIIEIRPTVDYLDGGRAAS